MNIVMGAYVFCFRVRFVENGGLQDLGLVEKRPVVTEYLLIRLK